MRGAANKTKLNRSSDLAPDPALSGIPIPSLEKLLSKFRKSRLTRAQALEVCRSLIKRKPANLAAPLAALPAPWADYAIATIYAKLISPKRRKKLGAYFTPPHLVAHLVSRLATCGMDPVNDRLRDPAAGGAAFLVPLARIKVAAWRKQGIDDFEIVRRLRLQLIGREIEADLATIANGLLRRMLTTEFNISAALASRLRLVKVGDSLKSQQSREAIDHEVGNPPFLRLRGDDKRSARSIFREMSTGRANLYSLFVRRALDEVPAGGLVGYVIPASFLGGPEFSSFRKRILQLAEVLVVDIVEKRSEVFVDAIQDACFIILRRRQQVLDLPPACAADSGVLHCDGKFVPKGTAQIGTNGSPWRLPGIELMRSAYLKDWGYKAVVGYLVSNRQTERLHKRAAKGRYPLIWAKAITTDGTFDFERGADLREFGWADAPANAPYVIRTSCVAVQRTSSRGQNRRLNAAAISKAFVKKHGGVVGENHVIFLVPLSNDAATPEALAEALNHPGASAALDRVCGSASISARLLETIDLPMPPSSTGS